MNTVLVGALAAILCLPATASASEEGRKSRIKVAVLDVRSGGALDPKTFEGVASVMATVLSEARPDLQVVNSADIRTMIGFEREKQLLGCSESNCMAEIGGALGVDFILSTESSKVPGKWLLTLSLLDVVKSTPHKRVSKMTDDEKKIVDLCVEAVRELAASVPRRDGASAPVAAPEVAPAPPVAVAQKSGGPAVSPAVSWTLVAAGLVVAGGGAGSLGYSYSLHSDYVARTSNGSMPKAEAQSKASSGKLLSQVGVTAISVGAAALVAGVVTFFIPGSSAGPQVGLAPVPGGAQASLTIPLP